MSPPIDPGGGYGQPGSVQDENNHRSLDSMTSARAEGGGTSSQGPKLRSFAEIIAEEKSNRNIIQIHLKKITEVQENGDSIKPRSLNFDDLGELIFDILGINYDDCLSFNFSSGRYDTREVKIKPGIDVTPYLTTLEPLVFKGHEVRVKKQRNNVTKITFKHVPLNIPDEELLHLGSHYGKLVDNTVHVERLTNVRNKGMLGSTKWIEVELNQGASMENFYWLEGPLPGDDGCRITVLHNGQIQQCSNCLRRADQGCPGQGNGKACETLLTPRTKMSVYMKSLKVKVGYMTLKAKYMEEEQKNYPALSGAADVGAYDNIEEKEVESEENTEDQQELETKIAELEKELLDLPALRENLAKVSGELRKEKKANYVAQNKVKFAKTVAEKKLAECFSDDSVDDSHLIVLYSSLLNEEDFEVDLASNTINADDGFLNDFMKNIDMKDPEVDGKVSILRNKLLERIKTNKERRISRRHSSSLPSSPLGGRKRDLESPEASKDAHNSRFKEDPTVTKHSK